MLSSYWCQTPMSKVARTPVGVPCPGAKTRKNWKGVRHATLVEEVVRQCAARDWCPGKPVIDLSPNGEDMVFALSFAGKSTTGTTRALAVSASNGGRRSCRLYAGGYQSGVGVVIDSTQGPAYSVALDLPAAVTGWLDWYETTIPDLPHLRNRLASRKADEFTTRDVLWWAARTKVLPWAKAGRVDATLKNRPAATMWDVLIAVGEQVGRTAAQDQCSNLLLVKQFVVALCGDPVPV